MAALRWAHTGSQTGSLQQQQQSQQQQQQQQQQQYQWQDIQSPVRSMSAGCCCSSNMVWLLCYTAMLLLSVLTSELATHRSLPAT
jgi:3-polyprenyl-4-hydroxybenzoate decarboxylase